MGNSGRRRAGALAPDERRNRGGSKSSGRDASSTVSRQLEEPPIKTRKVKRIWNPSQLEAINWGEGPVVVSSCAGSGKTSSIIARIVKLIERGIDPRCILATTFTKKAAEEMNTRLRAQGVDTDDMSVQTMHSFCFRLLKKNGFDSWEVDDADQYNIVIKSVTGFKGMKWRGCDITLVEQFISLAKNSLIRPHDCMTWDVFRNDPFYGDGRYIEAYTHAESTRKNKKLMTFDDMLIDGVELLQKNQSVREKVQEKYHYVIIDEFQDSNLAQLRLMELVSEPRWNLMVVGDADQCQPAGTKILTVVGNKNIEDLTDGSTVKVWNRHAGRIVGNEEIQTTKRMFVGNLFTIEADTYKTSATYNHKFFVRWNRDIDCWITYIMYRQDRGYRVGWCKLFVNVDKTYHFGQRCRLEKADKGWIIGVYDNSRDASINESILALTYGIPTAMFEPNGIQYRDEDALEQIFAASKDSNGIQCLTDFGRNPEYPLWERNKSEPGGKARGTIFKTAACNLVPYLMVVPTIEGWSTISDITFQPNWHGEVFSLNVEKEHSYVADGIVVSNSIYEWRGARPEFMVSFAEKYKAHTIKMGINYRCAPNIVTGAAKCIVNNQLRIAQELTASKQKEGTILCREASDQDEEANIVADEIERLTSSEEVKFGQVYILFRTNAQSRALEEVFSKRKFPYVVLGGGSFYQRKEVQDLLSYLRLLVDPRNHEAGKRAISRPFRYVAMNILEKIEEIEGDEKNGYVAACRTCSSRFNNRGVSDFYYLMSELDQKIKNDEKGGHKNTVGEIINWVVQKTNFIDYLTQNEGSDTLENSRAANVGELIRSADRYFDIEEFLKFVNWQIQQRKKQQKNDNSDVIQCMTCHRAKGLENKAVFLIGVNEGILPHANATEPYEEERRLFYVGMTRAEEFLHISFVRALGMKGKMLDQSRFLEEAGLKLSIGLTGE